MVLQLATLLRRTKRLPVSLFNFVTNPRIKKAGVAVTQDLGLILKDYAALPNGSARYQTGVPAGAFELGAFVMNQGVRESSSSKLDLVCATVLQRCLEKPEDVRLSEDWEEDDLQSGHLRYTALDAAVGLDIYTKLASLPLPPFSPLPPNLVTPGTRVVHLQDDSSNQIVRGTIQHLHSDLTPPNHPSPPKQLHDINLTKTRATIRVSFISLFRLFHHILGLMNSTGD